jgi:protein-S-isoprenylcysteine O-methyltransferase Ste14
VGIGTSIFLIAVGAILKYAVTGHVSGVDLDTVGIILMVAGAIGLVLSLLWTMVWADRTRGDRTVLTEPASRRRVVDRDVY